MNELFQSYNKLKNLKIFHLEMNNNKIKAINSFKKNENVVELKINLRNNKISDVENFMNSIYNVERLKKLDLNLSENLIEKLDKIQEKNKI